MTNPSDSPREARIRERFAHLLEVDQVNDPALLGHDLDGFVRGLTFFATEGRPVFRIVSNNLPPDGVMALADRAVDEILTEEEPSA